MKSPFNLQLQTIVVATDLTDASNAAMEYARLLAGKTGARVILTHVIDPLSYANLSDVPETVLQSLNKEARHKIEQLSDELLSAGIPSHSVVRQGLVADLLLQVAEQYQADLLVLGTDRAQGAGQVALGSVAEQVVRRANCAVLAVAADAIHPDVEHSFVGGHFLVPVQRTTASLSVLSTAQSLAAQFAGDVILLHVRTEEEIAAQLNPCAQGLSFPVTEPRVSVRCLVRDGEAAAVIEHTALQYRVSMIVMAVNRESRNRAGLHGTAFEVIAGSRVPVLCVPAAKAVAAGLIPKPEAVEAC
jgi:nucleotide-binding universal stress UspA family protein